MASRQHSSPMLVRGDAESVLEQVHADDLGKQEYWLQQFLFRHSRVIPVDEIEPAFGKLIPIAAELPTDSGPLDLLFVNVRGQITLVETKLWRNPEARRQVIGQIINYATEISGWRYVDLVSSVRRATKSSDADPLVSIVRASAGEEFVETDFIDTVSRNLERGRFLLLVIGDGIHEAVEDMAHYLQKAPQLGFTLGLIEMALFRESGGSGDAFFVQPRVVVRTREVPRAIVEIRSRVDTVTVKVSVPDAPTEPETSARRRSAPLSAEMFLEELGKTAGANIAAMAREMLGEAPSHNLEVDYRPISGPIIKFTDDNTGEFFNFGQIGRDGTLKSSSRLSEKCVRLGVKPAVWQNYYKAVEKMIPGVRREALTEKSTPAPFARVVAPDGSDPPLENLLRQAKLWYQAIDEAIIEIRDDLAKRIE